MCVCVVCVGADLMCVGGWCVVVCGVWYCLLALLISGAFVCCCRGLALCYCASARVCCGVYVFVLCYGWFALRCCVLFSVSVLIYVVMCCLWCVLCVCVCFVLYIRL